MSKQNQGAAGWALLLVAGILAGCAQTNEAPVESRGGFGSGTQAVNPATLPGAENAGKPGYYTVKPGDTLIRIGLEHGQSWKDIARWSQLANPDIIEVGQVVRVVPPGQAPGEATKPVASVATPVVQGTALPPAGSSSASAPAAAPAPAATAGAQDGDARGLGFIWPASGTVIAGFNESTNKGVGIAGKAGDPVVAADSGVVIYADWMGGYGNAVIIDHGGGVSTLYGHNSELLVGEGQRVNKGQVIARAGSTGYSTGPHVHFEVRLNGSPTNPLDYLP